MKAIEKIYQCIDENTSFVLQGGAGSGKTETLKDTLQYISQTYYDKNIACITHTNLAADEIRERVGDGYDISTIHSFINTLIKDYKKNIHQVIFHLFELEEIEYFDVTHYSDEKEQKKEEHEKYKKLYKKYASKLYTIKTESVDKVLGKRDYDKDPLEYNRVLNKKIIELNSVMINEITEKDFNNIEYNDTRFDDYKNLTFGHDGLLEIASLLFSKYPRLRKILTDSYDYIFIDEYQDTSEKIIDIFISDNSKVGLFGDSMQAIYEDGIGNVRKYIDDSKLKEIVKKDNYRCSEQVIEFINKLRNDKLIQEVAFKKLKNGVLEEITDRQGTVEFFYTIYVNKPHARSSQEDKDSYRGFLDKFILNVNEGRDFTNLMLTNKSISSKAGFETLYDIFNKRYLDPKEHLNEVLTKLQFLDLFEICNAFVSKDYNFILSKLKRNGFAIKSIKDKKEIAKNIQNILDSKLSAIETIKLAFEYNLVNKADKFDEYIHFKDVFLEDLSENGKYKAFKRQYQLGNSTFAKMKKINTDIEEEEFDDLKREVKKEVFYIDLFSSEITFSEIINYYNYLNEETEYITMHKTKGSSIENVTVVLDEYFWNDYNFKSLYDLDVKADMKEKTEKLFYVACSRTKTNLCCIRVIEEDEEMALLKLFPEAQKIDLA